MASLNRVPTRAIAEHLPNKFRARLFGGLFVFQRHSFIRERSIVLTFACQSQPETSACIELGLQLVTGAALVLATETSLGVPRFKSAVMGRTVSGARRDR